MLEHITLMPTFGTICPQCVRPCNASRQLSKYQPDGTDLTVATPCWPAPVSAMILSLPIRRHSST